MAKDLFELRFLAKNARAVQRDRDRREKQLERDRKARLRNARRYYDNAREAEAAHG